MRWIAMKSGTDIHVILRMNCNVFWDPQKFHLVPSLCQNLNLSLLMIKNLKNN